MATLENHYHQFPAPRGAAQEGPTVLPWLVWCKHGGRKIRIHSHNGQPYYLCDGEHREYSPRTKLSKRVFQQAGTFYDVGEQGYVAANVELVSCQGRHVAVATPVNKYIMPG